MKLPFQKKKPVACSTDEEDESASNEESNFLFVNG